MSAPGRPKRSAFELQREANPMNATVMRPWRHLWWRIWLAVLAAVALVSVVSFAILRLAFDPDRLGPSADLLAQQIAETLPSAGAPSTDVQQALERALGRTDGLAVFDAARRPLAQAGRPVPPPRWRFADSHWLTRFPLDGRFDDGKVENRSAARVQAFALRLDDGRWLVVGRDPRPRRPVVLAFWFALLAAGTALGAYPVVRRLTFRLEALQRGVDELGHGDLRARVSVEGNDEVARLATSFNTAAARIEQLVDAQRSLLANASHELRSPLARIRLALELLQRDALPDQRAALKRELERDIGELDQLIDEILLASRLDAQGAAREAPFEPLDLTALAAEECARFGARLEAGPIAAVGDARLLRRLLRNLLDNARRHAPGAPIDVTLRARPGEVELTVADRGPGVDEAERSRIFEPFYRPRGAGESAGGAGLGLALAARIAHRHRGTVACLPRAGGGTEFVVRLPIAAD
jgi:signal transduction histidine kinase